MYSRILVPIDAGEPAASGLREAIRIAAGTDAMLVLVNVVRESTLVMEGATMTDFKDAVEALHGVGQAMADQAAASAALSRVRCETVVVDARSSTAWEAILQQANASHCDLIVMGTHGRRGLGRLTMGSEAELVMRHCDMPILLVKAAPRQERQ